MENGFGYYNCDQTAEQPLQQEHCHRKKKRCRRRDLMNIFGTNNGNVNIININTRRRRNNDDMSC